MNRKRQNTMLAVALSAGLLLGATGCAMLTTERVATFVATQVGKKAIKDIKEDMDEKEAAESQQQPTPQNTNQQPTPDDQLEPR